MYARVSKALEQTPDNQLIALREWAASSKNEVVGEYVDETSSKDTRPEKERVLRMIRLGEIDGVACWSLDRWGRTASELILELEEFSKTDKALICLKEGLDLSTAAGRLYANLIAIFANFERDRNSERTFLGLVRAKKEGKIGGRHPVGCGCGLVLPNGKKHDGPIKPIRDASNKVVGWKDEREQTPPSNPAIKTDEASKTEQPSVCLPAQTSAD